MSLLNDLAGSKPSLFSKLINIVGLIALCILLPLLILYKDRQLANDAWQIQLGSICALTFFGAYFLLAVRYLAINKTGHASINGVMGVFWRVFLYMFAPALVIGGILFLYVYIKNR